MIYYIALACVVLCIVDLFIDMLRYRQIERKYRELLEENNRKLAILIRDK